MKRRPVQLFHRVFGEGTNAVAVFLLFEPRDLWLGLYWDEGPAEYGSRRLDLYICVLPLLPLRISIQRETR